MANVYIYRRFVRRRDDTQRREPVLVSVKCVAIEYTGTPVTVHDQNTSRSTPTHNCGGCTVVPAALLM